MSMTGLGCRGSVSVSAPASASSEDSCWTIRARSPTRKKRLDGSVRGSVLVRGEEDGAGVVRALQQEPDGGEESVEVRGLVVEDVRAEHEVDAARGEAEGGGVKGAPVEREDVHAGRVEAVGVARRGEVREHLGLARGVGEGHARAELGEEQPGKRGARTELHDARRGSGVGRYLARCRHACRASDSADAQVYCPYDSGRSTSSVTTSVRTRFPESPNVCVSVAHEPPIPARASEGRGRTLTMCARREYGEILVYVLSYDWSNRPSVCNHGHNYEPGSRRQ